MEQSAELEKALGEAELLLVGIGAQLSIKAQQDMEKGLMPLAVELELKKSEEGKERQRAYGNLAALLAGRNYFIVTTNTDSLIYHSGLQADRIVAPCGCSLKLQCDTGCTEELYDADPALASLESCRNGTGSAPEAGKCPHCGAPLVCNTVYASHYVEAGYLPQWDRYMKWLQGTMNRRLCVLELGVGMEYPGIIRWPFEKAAYFNQKAVFIRVHDKLYQLPEDIAERGISVKENAVTFLTACQAFPHVLN